MYSNEGLCDIFINVGFIRVLTFELNYSLIVLIPSFNVRFQQLNKVNKIS